MLKKLVACLLAVSFLVISHVALAGETITIRHWMTPPNELYVSLLEQFEEEHPNIKMEVEGIPPGNMAQKVMLAIAAGDTPDVLMDYLGRTSSWCHYDALELLNDTLTPEDIEDFYPSIIDLFTIDGNFFAYPGVYGVRTYMVNKTILERAGVANLLPQGLNREWTLDTWMKVAGKIKALGIYPTAFFCNGASGDYMTLENFKMFGASLYEDGNYRKTTLNSEAGVKALEWMLDIVKKEYAPRGIPGFTDDHYVEMFFSGKVAMGGMFTILDQTMAKTNFENKLIDYVADFYLVQTPHIKDAPAPGLYTGPNSFVLFKDKSKERKEAGIKFIKFMTAKEAMQKICDAEQVSLSPRKSTVLLSETLKVAQKTIENNGIADLGIASPYYLEVRNLQFPELQAAFLGKKSPQQALDDFAKAVEKLWKK